MYTIREIAEKCNADSDFSGKVLCDEPLFARTTMHVGGNAALLLEPTDEDSLLFALGLVRENSVPFFVLGGGSNVIISDSGFDGVVISARKLSGVENCPQLKRMHEDEKDTIGLSEKKNPDLAPESSVSGESCLAESCITVAAGTPWGSVISFCREHDLGGLEVFTGLSGTVGGAVYMNATCFGLSACDCLVSVRYVDVESGEVRTYTMDDEKRKIDWGYKKSPFQKRFAVAQQAERGLGRSPRREGSEQRSASEGETSPYRLILSAQFSLSKGFDAQKSESCITQRKEKGHFLAPSAGSVFKNDVANGVIAGKVIDECELKGLQIGGAQVAPWHGNFIVNTGDATAQDIFDLVQLIKKIVAEKKSIALECEIIFIGKFFLH